MYVPFRNYPPGLTRHIAHRSTRITLGCRRSDALRAHHRLVLHGVMEALLHLTDNKGKGICTIEEGDAIFHLICQLVRYCNSPISFTSSIVPIIIDSGSGEPVNPLDLSSFY